MTTTIRLRGHADIISVLPYHLGYHPADSLVLVCLTGGRFGFVARLDLPPPSVDPWGAVDELVPLVLRERSDDVVVIAYESTAGQSARLSAAIRDGLLDVGVPVGARLLVRGRRWWSLDCACDACPPDGAALPSDDHVPAIAQYVLMGRRPAVDRRSLGERLAPTDDPEVDTRCAALMRRLRLESRDWWPVRSDRKKKRSDWTEQGGRPERLADHPVAAAAVRRIRSTAVAHWGTLLDVHDENPWITRQRSSEDLLDTEAMTWASVSLLDHAVRDLLVAWLCPGSMDLEKLPDGIGDLVSRHLPARPEGPGVSDDAVVAAREGVVEVLAEVCRRTPVELTPGPLTLLAYVVWWLGDGAMARTALDRALAVDPEYGLALALKPMVELAVRPRASA